MRLILYTPLNIWYLAPMFDNQVKRLIHVAYRVNQLKPHTRDRLRDEAYDLSKETKNNKELFEALSKVDTALFDGKCYSDTLSYEQMPKPNLDYEKWDKNWKKVVLESYVSLYHWTQRIKEITDFKE